MTRPDGAEPAASSPPPPAAATDGGSQVATLPAHWGSTRPGLTSAEVAERVARGEVNAVPAAPTRTVGEIVRANVLTPINLVIGILAVLVFAAGSPKDGLFAGVIVANSVI